MADQKDSSTQDHDDHTHEIAGIRVGERNVPASVIAVFIFVLFFALISWIAPQGF